MINKFDAFNKLNESRSDSAGVVILLQQENESSKILLVHPRNGSWTRPVMGIPKGKIESGESVLDAALRELKEETGIHLKPAQLDQGVESIEVWRGSTFSHSIHYVVCQIHDPAEIGLASIQVPKSQIQAEEVDWVGFVEIDKAYGLISAAQRIILDRVR